MGIIFCQFKSNHFELENGVMIVRGCDNYFTLGDRFTSRLPFHTVINYVIWIFWFYKVGNCFLFFFYNVAPFPGGCCLTCNMELDPNIVISYDAVETNITFSFANVYYGRSVFHILKKHVLFKQ